MAVVVFGGAGFVGLNIVEALLRRGEDAVVFDATPLPEAAAAAFASLEGSLRVVTGDVRVPADVEAAFADGATGVVYGAAITAGFERDRDEPARILDVNLRGLLNALHAARSAGVRRTINLSSAGAFGAAAFAHDILTEETPTDPQSLYSITKFASERMTARMAGVWQMDAISVRLSGVFGRWERKTSVRDTPSAPFQVMAAARAGRPVRLPRRDWRDWVYAPDVAAAVLALMDAPQLSHGLYHVSTGERWAVADWAEALGRHMPVDCRLARSDEEPTIDFYGDTDRGMLDVTRLLTDTAFRPSFDMAGSAADYATWIATHGGEPG